MLQLDEISLEERCPSFVTDVERWKASGPLGRGEIIIAPKAYIESVLTLPQWGPFSKFEITIFPCSSRLIKVVPSPQYSFHQSDA